MMIILFSDLLFAGRRKIMIYRLTYKKPERKRNKNFIPITISIFLSQLLRCHNTYKSNRFAIDREFDPSDKLYWYKYFL